jgi:hypothetical protein
VVEPEEAVDRAAAGGRLRLRERWVPYAFVAPLLLVFALFYLWPAFVTFVSSSPGPTAAK